MVMTLFHGLICGVVALYTTRGLRSPCPMMAVRKRQNIVQWSYRRVPLNVVPRIPLWGYPDIDQRYLDWSPSLTQTVSRNSTGNFRHGNELQIEQSGLLGEPLYPLLPVSWFVGWHCFIALSTYFVPN